PDAVGQREIAVESGNKVAKETIEFEWVSNCAGSRSAENVNSLNLERFR
ncbi:MAG: hypothetical protein ACI8V5_004784, partial [Limisphaerales bacterium]